MGNCSTQKQQISQPGHPQLDKNIENAKKFEKPEQLFITIPENISKCQRQGDKGIKSKITQPIKQSKDYKKYMQIKENQKYVDQQFEAGKKVLMGLESAQLKNIQWKRPMQISKESILCIYNSQIDSSDLKQGKLENSYFVSAFSALAQNNIFFWDIIGNVLNNNLTLSDNGAYLVWLFLDGQWQSVIIDDLFPTSFHQYLFSKYGKQIWPLVIQKAYAKFFKSYVAIQKGILGNFLSSLSGAPCEYLRKDSQRLPSLDNVWKIIREAQKKGHYISISTESVDCSNYFQRDSTFSYSVIDTQEVYVLTRTNQQLQRILKLNNAWGRYEWKGRWSEYSDVWSQQLRTQLGYEKADESVMWISIQDALKSFGQICICRYESNYTNSWINLNIEQRQIKGIFLNIQEKTSGYLNIYQKDYRHYFKSYKYSTSRLIILSLNPETKKLENIISQTIDSSYCSITPFQLQAGVYYVLLEIDWESSFTRDIVINVYSQNPVGMMIDPTILNNDTIFYELAQIFQQKKSSEVQIFQYPEDNNITRSCGAFGGYVFYHYQNRTNKNAILKQNFKLDNSKNLEICNNPNAKQLFMEIRQGQQMLLKLKIKNHNIDYVLDPKIDYQFVEKYKVTELESMLKKKPTSIKQRQIDQKPIELYIRKFEYSGGVALLYQNLMNKYCYIEEITLDIKNLKLENENISSQNKIDIQISPNSEKLLSFVVLDNNKPYIFKTKVTYYLGTPEFVF